MNLLCTATGEVESDLVAQALSYWCAKKHLFSYVPARQLTGYLRFDTDSSHALVDAIVCFADGPLFYSFRLGEEPILTFALEHALMLAEDVRALPPSVAMRDGKQWRSIPFIIFAGVHSLGRGGVSELDTHAKVFTVAQHRHVYGRLTLYYVELVVKQFETTVLDDYERCGLLVRVERGRLQVLPALRRKHNKHESDYYYRPSDRRRRNHWVTYSRDIQGLSADVEEFAALLNANANERELHAFFERNPILLTQARGGIPISHAPRFMQPAGEMPDMLIAPILGPTSGTLELMELKGPAEKTLTKRRHGGFSMKVRRAIDQVRDYDRQMNDPRNRYAMMKALGTADTPLRRLAVLIGRAPTSASGRELRERRQSETDVEIVTYDEILQTQLDQLE